MPRNLTAGLVTDAVRLGLLAQPLLDRGIRLVTRPVPLEAAGPGPVDVLLVDTAGIGATPQHASQRFRIWGALPFIAIAPGFDLAAARVWRSLGAAEYLAQGEIDRLVLVLEAVARANAAATSDLLQTVIDAVPAPIFFKDEKGVYLGCNRAFEGIIGVSPEEIVGKSVFDLAPRELAEVYQKADNDLLGAGGQQVYETQVRFKDGSVRDVMFHKATFNNRDGALGGLVGAMLDITERKRLEEQLARFAAVDPLTGICNRRTFMKLSEGELSRCKRERQVLSLLVLDIDHFKRINDTYGHAAGDTVLVNLVHVVTTLLRQHDIVGRIGGEEFCATLGSTDLAAAESIAQRMCRALAEASVAHQGERIAVTVSIGVAQCDPELDSVESAMQRADLAMYEAKRLGRNRVVPASSTAAR
jgi:diguanylate cyclase (GGDEF)-like protein/PAS domain S-box-containing protein